MVEWRFSHEMHLKFGLQQMSQELRLKKERQFMSRRPRVYIPPSDLSKSRYAMSEIVLATFHDPDRERGWNWQDDDGNVHVPPEVQANVNLYVGAPDLLKACQEALASFENPNMLKFRGYVATHLRAAIAAATGSAVQA